MSGIDQETPNRPTRVDYYLDDDDDEDTGEDDEEGEKGQGKQGKGNNEDELEDEEDEAEDIEAKEPTMSKGALENILSHQAVITDKILHEMLTHLQLSKECMSEDVNLLAIGNTTRKPPLLWHGQYGTQKFGRNVVRRLSLSQKK